MYRALQICCPSYGCILRHQADRNVFPCPQCRTLCDSESMGRVPFIDRQVKNLKVRCVNSVITPERAEYIKRKQREAEKRNAENNENTDSHSHRDNDDEKEGENREEIENDDEEEEGDENEGIIADEARPCGPMRIERKRKLNELCDRSLNVDHKRRKTNGSETCEWIGALMDLETHIMTCPYQLTSCFYCKLKVENWELADHHKVCDRYPVECGSCKQTGIPRKRLPHHRDKVCPAGIVQCDECGQTYRRSKLPDHKKYSCPETHVDCLLHEFGCECAVKRKDQVKHIEERIVDHLGIIVSSMKKQKEKIEEQQQEIHDLRREVQRLSGIPMIQQAIDIGASQNPYRRNRNGLNSNAVVSSVSRYSFAHGVNRNNIVSGRAVSGNDISSLFQ